MTYSAPLPDPYSEAVVLDVTEGFFKDAPATVGTDEGGNPVVTVDPGTDPHVHFPNYIDLWKIAVLEHDPNGATVVKNARAVRDNARAALADNRAFIANAYPQIVSGADAILGNANATTREKQLAQGMKALANQQRDTARMTNGLIRLALGSFDGTD